MEKTSIDCSRGTVATQDPSTGETTVSYREGCCKLRDYNYLAGITDESVKDLFEVRFKNTRKGIYRNASGQNVKIGDMVIVESSTGCDLGIVTLEGPLVAKQMACKGVQPTDEFRKIYRKAKQSDVEKWQEAIAREQDTMIQARRIAAEMGLDMKIGDVEFQGDGSKAIFYYIADGRVDFRQLIKVFAEEFRIRIEMKQIGARQEAGLIGGIGVCGRELCCARYITHFKSISTSAARVQDLSLNPQKLAGQCGKLKCCLNYEYDAYVDALKAFPDPINLKFKNGDAIHQKNDVFKGIMWYSYVTDKGNIMAIPVEKVKEIIAKNKKGELPEKLEDYAVTKEQHTNTNEGYSEGDLKKMSD